MELYNQIKNHEKEKWKQKKMLKMLLQKTYERYREEEELAFDNFVWDKLNR